MGRIRRAVRAYGSAARSYRKAGRKKGKFHL